MCLWEGTQNCCEGRGDYSLMGEGRDTPIPSPHIGQACVTIFYDKLISIPINTFESSCQGFLLVCLIQVSYIGIVVKLVS